MPIIMLIIVGAAAGLVATRLMRVEADLITTVVIGIAGALVGGMILRGILMLGGMAWGFVGATLGAMALIWLWNLYVRKGR
ncbi:MAG: GlsB/YeaQ/YmgE family stress response membrane protein [Paracoccaceae bacterium]